MRVMYEAIASATRVRSEAHSDYATLCQRCGAQTAPRWLHRTEDGLHLCRDCRESGDRHWVRMARGEVEFRWTTDEELAALDACNIIGPSPSVGRREWMCTTHKAVCQVKDTSQPRGRGRRKADMFCPMEGMAEIEEAS